MTTLRKLALMALVGLSVFLFNPAPASAAYAVSTAYVYNATNTTQWALMRSPTTGLRYWKLVYNGHGTTVGAEGFEIPDNWRFRVQSVTSGNVWTTACGRYYETWKGAHFAAVETGHPVRLLSYSTSTSGNGC